MIDLSTVDWRVYAIIDAAGPAPLELVRAVIAGGAGVVQLRDKRGDARQMLELGRAIRDICTVPLIVNDRVDIALALGADGVHVGPTDLPVAEVRRIAPNLIVGASAGTAEDAIAAVAAGAHYLGSGAVFDATGSKPDAHHNRGLAALELVVKSVDVPVVGIGGITLSNARRVRETGAAGVAVIRALAEAEEPVRATAALLAP